VSPLVVLVLLSDDEIKITKKHKKHAFPGVDCRFSFWKIIWIFRDSLSPDSKAGVPIILVDKSPLRRQGGGVAPFARGYPLFTILPLKSHERI
jgi:hypothetical protein